MATRKVNQAVRRRLLRNTLPANRTVTKGDNKTAVHFGPNAVKNLNALPEDFLEWEQTRQLRDEGVFIIIEI